MNEHEKEEEWKEIHTKKNAHKTEALIKSHQNGYVIINIYIYEIIEYVDTQCKLFFEMEMDERETLWIAQSDWCGEQCTPLLLLLFADANDETVKN